MNKTVSNCIFVVSIGVWVAVSLAAPWVLSDKNEFLKGFVAHELLPVLGVFVAITLASTASLHLEFNRIEYAVKKTFLSGTRAAVKKSAISLIALFAMASALVVVKPLLDTQSEVAMAIVNGLALLILIFNLLVLVDLTQLVFKIEPIHKLLGEEDDHGSGS